MFQSFFSKFVPRVRAEEDAQEEEELVDPQQTLRKLTLQDESHKLLQTIKHNVVKRSIQQLMGARTYKYRSLVVCMMGYLNGGADKCREGHHAKSLAEKYQACNDRVNSRSQTAETCVEELFDLLHAIDHCVTEKLFNQLK